MSAARCVPAARCATFSTAMNATDPARRLGRIYVPWKRPRPGVTRRGWWEAIKRAIIADEELSAEYSRIDDELRAKGL